MKWISIIIISCFISTSCTTSIVSGGDDTVTDITTKKQGVAAVEIDANPDDGFGISFRMTADNISIDWGDGDKETLSPNGDEALCKHVYVDKNLKTIKVESKNALNFFVYGSGGQFAKFVALRFSDCSALKSIVAIGCKYLQTVEISGAPALEKLKLTGTLKTFDYISGLSALKELTLCLDAESVTVNSPTLETISFHADTEMKGDNLKSLDVSGCTALTSLECYKPQLKYLNIKGCKNLKTLACASTMLGVLDLSACPALVELNCSATQLTSLDVKSNTALEHLVCSGNSISSLDLTANKALKYLHCGSNRLTSLNLDNNKSLQYLNCADNRLASLNTKACPNLLTLDFSGNGLKTMDTADNALLTFVNCKSNQMSDKELNSLFEHLPKRVERDNASIIVANNPSADDSGTNNCDRSIATHKKWRVK